MAGNVLYDVGMRVRAAELYDEGCGRASIASLLGIPEETVKKRLNSYRSAGVEVLAMMGRKHTTYSFETKHALRGVPSRREGPFAIRRPQSSMVSSTGQWSEP